MAATLRLTVVTGPHRGTRFCIREPNACMLGRAAGCQIRLCGSERDLCISRNHCQLLFDTAKLCVQDMDSANGTYINGKKVGASTTIAEIFKGEAPVGVAGDGDVITVGGTSLMVNIMDCPEDFGALSDKSIVKQDCPIDC